LWDDSQVEKSAKTEATENKAKSRIVVATDAIDWNLSNPDDQITKLEFLKILNEEEISVCVDDTAILWNEASSSSENFSKEEFLEMTNNQAIAMISWNDSVNDPDRDNHGKSFTKSDYSASEGLDPRNIRYWNETDIGKKDPFLKSEYLTIARLTERDISQWNKLEPRITHREAEKALNTSPSP